MENYGIDPELLAGFIAESRESLEPVDGLLIDLEKHPDDTDIINKIFRPFHSIKGSAAFFGLLKVKQLSHLLEDLLDMIRQKQVGVSVEITTVTLAGLDMLRKIFENVTADKPETEGVDDQYSQLAESIRQAAQTRAMAAETLIALIHDQLESLHLSPDDETAAQINDILKKIDTHFHGSPPTSKKAVQKEEAADNPVNFIRRILDTEIDGELDATESIAVQRALEQIQIAVTGNPEAEKIVAQALENYHAFMENIGFDTLLRDLILESMNRLSRTWQWPASEAATSNVSEKTASEPRRKTGVQRTMRVYEKSIDGFLEYVGELVVIEEMFNHVQKQLDAIARGTSIASDFRRILKTFHALSANLRNSILEIRSVPISGLLRKAPRIVHDIARDHEKAIDVRITGESLLIDKSYLELLDAPFIHMVRNAADHGVENRQERIQVGKPETGEIQITARETDKEIEITISDDGKGIDYDALYQKAREWGLVNGQESIDQTTVTDLVFMPGISTAKTVTDISGRGVGMDVVRQNIESAGGRVVITTTPGAGTIFSVLLPKNVSTQIIEGFLIQATDDVYVLPMELVNESFAFHAGDVSDITGKGRMIARRDTLMPLINLNAALRENGNGYQFSLNDASEGTVIAVNTKGKMVALLVDRIIGVQKMILKEVEGLTAQRHLFQGAGIMGDGTVAMIIGAEGVSALAV
ncbi:MAG: ATP-binding protein [Thermodesulfobacteriota bacterium]|nr:ATP-binding protein [Thermodesulfobacteriota bacterium]